MLKKNKIYSSAMLTATALSLATPTIANAATTNPAPAADKVVAQQDKQTDNKSANKTEVDKTTNKSGDKSTDKTTAAVVNDKKESDPDNPQTLKEQTMIINKVIASSDKDTSTDNLKGVNGAKFTVYDVTDLMNTIIKEELKTSDSKSSDSQIDDAIKKAEDTSTTDTVNADKTDNAKSDDKNAETKKTDAKTAPTTSKQEAKDTKVDKAKEDSKNQAKAQTSAKDPKTQAENTDTKAKNDKSSDTTDKKVDADKDSAADKKEDSTADDALVKKVDQMRKDDTLRKEISTRAAKLDTTQMKKFAEVTTAHDNATKKDGVAKVKLPIDGKYHAYYVVNTETPKEAMAKNSDPIVVITPITDKDGKYSPDFTVYPKSEAIKPADKQTPGQPSQPGQTISQAKMYQTGKSHGFWENVVSYVQNLFS